jgi:hypothetical protein
MGAWVREARRLKVIPGNGPVTFSCWLPSSPLRLPSSSSSRRGVIEQRKHHTRDAKRLRSLAPSVTTAALRARILQRAREHAAFARFDNDPPALRGQPAR